MELKKFEPNKSCSEIPSADISEVYRLIFRDSSRKIPLEGSFELTFRCNLKCRHCYCNLSAADKSARQRELSYQEVCRLIDEVADEGCLWLFFTGGEPLLRNDFWNIYKYTKKKGIIVSIFTNGTLLTPKAIAILKEFPPYRVEITLYGATKETYERVTGVKGSYEKCMRGIGLLVQEKIPMSLKTVVISLNYHEVEDMRRFSQKIGAKFRLDPLIHSRFDGNRQPIDLRVSPEEVIRLDLQDEERIKEWRDLYVRLYGKVSRPELLFGCGAGLNNFHIDPYGKLCACIMSRKITFNLRQGNFREGWIDLVAKVRKTPASKNYACNDCPLISICGQCPGWVIMEHGGRQRATKYLCDITKLRIAIFRKELGIDLLSGKGGKLSYGQKEIPKAAVK